MQFVAQFLVDTSLQTLREQKRQFVGVLARGRHSNSSLPVVVEMRQLEGELKYLGFKTQITNNTHLSSQLTN